MKMNLDKLAGQYLEYLQYQRHYSIKTIESYNRQIKHFIYFLNQEAITDYNDVNYLMLRGYLTKLYEENLAKTSINS